MMQHECWFPAKPPERGWGWGTPQTWQGWVVYIGYLVLLAAGILLILPHHAGYFLA